MSATPTNAVVSPAWKSLGKTSLIAAALFVFDALMLNQGLIALCLIFLTLLVFLPRALWVRRSDRRLYQRRLTKAGIYLLAAVAIFACNDWQNQMADRRAIKIGNACLAFHAKYQRYPNRLQELVPEFLPAVPVAKYMLGGADHFFYFSPPSGTEPMLYYEALPPFGRRFYHLESGAWGYLD
jgi:hypothetical protein